jgi:hypothetical protein
VALQGRPVGAARRLSLRRVRSCVTPAAMRLTRELPNFTARACQMPPDASRRRSCREAPRRAR